MITPGDVDDRNPLEYKAFVEFIYGKLVGDKGYIGKRLFERLFVDGIQLITKLKSNMKGALMSVSDKLLLRKRAASPYHLLWRIRWQDDGQGDSTQQRQIPYHEATQLAL